MDGDNTEACPRCGGIDLVYDPETGEVVCTSCGAVIWEEPLERGPPPETRLPERRTGRVSPETLRRMMRLRRYDEAARLEDLDPRTVRQATAELERLVDELHLARSHRDRAKAVFREAHERGLIQRGTIAGFAAASVYAACREAGISYSQFMKTLRDQDVRLNRKMLAEIAVRHPGAFKNLVDSLQQG